MGRSRPKPKTVYDWNSVPLMFDLSYASLIMNICPETLRQLSAKGNFPAKKIGTQWRVSKSDLIKYLGVKE